MTPQELDQAHRDLQWLSNATQCNTDTTLWLNHPVIEYLNEGFVSALERECYQKIKEQADKEIKQMEESLHNRGVDLTPFWAETLPVATRSALI